MQPIHIPSTENENPGNTYISTIKLEKIGGGVGENARERHHPKGHCLKKKFLE